MSRTFMKLIEKIDAAIDGESLDDIIPVMVTFIASASIRAIPALAGSLKFLRPISLLPVIVVSRSCRRGFCTRALAQSLASIAAAAFAARGGGMVASQAIVPVNPP